MTGPVRQITPDQYEICTTYVEANPLRKWSWKVVINGKIPYQYDGLSGVARKRETAIRRAEKVAIRERDRRDRHARSQATTTCQLAKFSY